MSEIFLITIIGYLAWIIYQDRVKVFKVRTLADNLSLPEKHYLKAVNIFPNGTSRAKFRSFARATLAERNK